MLSNIVAAKCLVLLGSVEQLQGKNIIIKSGLYIVCGVAANKQGFAGDVV